MKKLYLILMFVGVVLSGYAQRKAPAADIRTITIHLTDGSTIERPVWEVEKITFGTSEETLEATVPESAVDLGLSVQWAPFNIGAASASEAGFLVGWGDVTARNHSTDLKYYPTLTPDGHIVNTSYDLAKVMWEDKWRMPTDGEINELITQCDWEWTEQDGVNGYLVKSRTNENSIFLPVTGKRKGAGSSNEDMGCYWSGILSDTDSNNALSLNFSADQIAIEDQLRSMGLAIRPVYGDYKLKVEVAINENGITKGQEAVSVPLIFTGTLSYVSDYGVAYATSETALNVQGNSRVNKSGVPNETTTITVGGLESNTTYYFKAYAVTEGNYVESNVISVTTDAKFPIPDAVDLGLSVKWAKWNMGASSEYEVGGYYGWGDPTGDMMSWTSSDYANGYTGTKIYGDEKYDIATANWGKGWRLPKKEEVEELMEKSTITATTQNGVAGYMLTCNGQSIFLPKGGYEYSNKFYYDNYSMYWTGETDSQLHPYELAIYSKTQYAIVANNNKATHMLIRPVYVSDSSGGGTSSNAYDKYAVDLGLRSLWSTVNLGATKNTASGKFYAWGETKANTSFKKEEYDYYDASTDAFISIGDEISNTEHDAVKAAWGGKWHMPTYYDFQELNERCTWVKKTIGGVQGYEVTGPSGKSIFLPMTGYYSSTNTEPAYATTKARYWAGTLYTLPTGDPTPNVYAYAYNLDIDTDPQASQPNKFYRYFGAVIRPVRTK